MGQQHAHAQPLDRPVRHIGTGARGPIHLTAQHVTIMATLACALVLGVFVVRDHFIGSEVWGAVAAVVGIAAGLLALSAGRHLGRRSVLATVVILWLIVAYMGIDGTLDHARPVLPEYLDQRARPTLVPLLFTITAGAAIAAAVRGSRAARHGPSRSERAR